MSGEMPFSGEVKDEGARASLLSSARLMPAPKTAAEKAAIASSLVVTPAQRALTKTRLAIGAAAAAIAVTVPNLSLEAMVSSVGGPYFGASNSGGPATELVTEKSSTAKLASEVWSPAQQVAGPVYAEVLAEKQSAILANESPRFRSFDQELPLAVLDAGSETFDLAFAGVETPAPLTALMAPPVSARSLDFAQNRRSAIATGTIAIEQITDLDLVVRATPENAPGNQQVLAVSTSSARTDAIANRSVEAAFAGAIDASSAVRSSLSVAPKTQAQIPQAQIPQAQIPQAQVSQAQVSQPQVSLARAPQPQVDEVQGAIPRAIPSGAPSPQVGAAAVAETVLVPKTSLDARVNGVLTGSVDFRQLDGTIAIRLRSVAQMMRGSFSQAQFAEIMSGQSIDNFVPIAELQAAGIPINYSPAYDEVEFGIDYKDAPNAKKVQVDQISIAPVGPELTAIEQIPR